jgi:hypothetical protein
LAINAGYLGTVPSVNLLSAIPSLPLDETGQAYIFLNASDTLQVAASVAVNSGQEGLMITWFANALMRGYDEAMSRVAKADEPLGA